MLEKLIDEIRKGDTLQPAVLAMRLDTSLELVTAMLEHLNRFGLLNQVDSSCQEPCGGCPLTSACGTGGKSNGRLWSVKNF